MLSKIPKFVSASELRQNLAKYLRRSRKEPVLISMDRGEHRGVLLSDELYNTLLEAYEDITDARLLTDLVADEKGKAVRWHRAKYGV